ncbi:MAG: LicD family protein [Lachnospiraceae bacterium]|nr:LicD family protein [Lachnospiraceae bacterium]
MYNDEVQKNLRKLQLAELNIIKVFMEICEREHLRYYMIGGTMLGAIRHKGFIPWDDDVDIGMPREDYDRLYELLKDGGNLPEHFEYLNYKIKDGYMRYFSRIVDNRVLVYNASGRKEIVEAAWIDLFPLDGSPNNALLRNIRYSFIMFKRMQYHLAFMDSMVNLNRPGRPLYQRIIIGLAKRIPIGRGKNGKDILDDIDRELKKYGWDGSSTGANVFGAYAHREIVPKTVWGQGVSKYAFEDVELPGPADYDAFLGRFYGNYMVLPPEEKRDKHNIRKIEFLDAAKEEGI